MIYSLSKLPPFVKLEFMSIRTVIHILITDFFPKEKVRNKLAYYFRLKINMLAYVMLLLFAYKLLHRCNQKRYLQIVIMKIKILWNYKYSWVYCFTTTCLYPDGCICRKRKEKTIHNERAKYEVVEFVFGKSLLHFTVDSFLPSRIHLCPCVEILPIFPNEVVPQSPPPW